MWIYRKKIKEMLSKGFEDLISGDVSRFPWTADNSYCTVNKHKNIRVMFHISDTECRVLVYVVQRSDACWTFERETEKLSRGSVSLSNHRQEFKGPCVKLLQPYVEKMYILALTEGLPKYYCA